jgi:hypothetical protein
MKERPRFRQSISFKDRLAAFAKEMREKADHMQCSPERDELLKKARQADAAVRIDEWAKSPGLQLRPPE